MHTATICQNGSIILTFSVVYNMVNLYASGDYDISDGRIS